jgi:RNA polymerase sigma-70 factor (ECF subfamily)
MDVTVDLPDATLWQLAGTGDGEAFGQLFDRHSRAVYNHCFRLTASWATAEDLTSTTFLLAWRQRDRLRLANDSLRPWLLGVATNAVRSHRRSAGRRLRLVARAPAEPPAADHADDVAGRVDDERRMAAVLTELRRLPPAEQEAVALCLWSGLSYADAAAALGIAEVSVRSRVSRARSKLRAALVPVLTEEIS